MKLLIVSNMAHYSRDGELVGFGPAVRELNHLCRIFSEVRHIACLHEEAAPDTALPYDVENLEFFGLPPAGGERFRDKVWAVARVPGYWRTIAGQLGWADMIHVRSPANVPMVALVLLALRRHPRLRWVKYAGAWGVADQRSRSAAFQRWWLRKNLSRSVVTVNGRWADQQPHVVTFDNPCFTRCELATARSSLDGKSLDRQGPRLLFVGRLEEAKGTGVAIRTLQRLRAKGVQAHLDLVGDGPRAQHYLELARTLGLGSCVSFHGWQPHGRLHQWYESAHFLLLPSRTEGWPKVVAEAMAHRAIPITSGVSCLPQVLEEIGCGVAVSQDDPDSYARAIGEFLESPRRWWDECLAGLHAADRFTFERYVEAVRETFFEPASP